MNVLDKIVAQKKIEVAQEKQLWSVADLQSSDWFGTKQYSLVSELQRATSPRVISEFKRQSPSKGIINDGLDVATVTKGYCEAGASAVSILTDHEFFGGHVRDLEAARPHVDCSILRKEFIIDAHQIYKSKAIGADLILLIAAILTKEEVKQFTDLAHELQLEVLLEIHNEEEFDAVYYDEVDILGVNNRDLKRFKTTIQNSIDLVKVLPEEQIKISESGISSVKEMELLFDLDYKGFLIGEQFMKHDDPAAELKRFLQQ